MNTNILQFRRQLGHVQFHTECRSNQIPAYYNNGHQRQRIKVVKTASSSYFGTPPTLEFAEEQVEIYDQILEDTTQQQKLQSNIICYFAAVGIIVLRAALLAFAQIEIFPNIGILMGFLGQQLQVGFSQLVLPTFGPPCLAAFAFLRWKFRHEMEALYLGSFGKILETTQKAGLVHNTKVAWEKLLISQWLLKYGLGWTIVTLIASLFAASHITNYFCADLSLTISNWMAQPCLGQSVTVGFLVGMINLWIASAFIGYVIMGDIINMGSYTILKLCMKFDKAGEKKEEDEEEYEEEGGGGFFENLFSVPEPPQQEQSSEKEQKQQTNQNGLGKNGISDLKVVDLDKEQYRNINKPQNSN